MCESNKELSIEMKVNCFIKRN